MAADSVVTLEGTINTPQGTQHGVIQTFEFANKLVRIKDYPVGVMCWGLGSISNRSIASLIMEWEHSYPVLEENKSFTVNNIAVALQQFIAERYTKAFPSTGTNPPPVLGLFIGGYSSGQFFSEQFQILFPGKISIVRPNKQDGSLDFGANWFGQIDALNRLIHGYDNTAIAELVKRGADKAIVQKWIDDHISELPLIFDGMPIQDAVDFANYAVQLTIGRFRFAAGVPVCGGNVDIAVITPTTFRWAQRKQWSIKE